MLSVHAKFVAMRRWPTESASFTASGSLLGLCLVLVEVLLLLDIVLRRLVRGLGDDEGGAAGVVDGGAVAGRDARGIGLRLVVRATDAAASERRRERRGKCAGDDGSRHGPAPIPPDDEHLHDTGPPPGLGPARSKGSATDDDRLEPANHSQLPASPDRRVGCCSNNGRQRSCEQHVKPS